MINSLTPRVLLAYHAEGCQEYTRSCKNVKGEDEIHTSH